MSATFAGVVPVPAGDGETVVAPPGNGPGYWAGGPSAVATADGIYLAYRLRRPVDMGRGYAIVVAHSADGVALQPLVTLTKEQFATASFERPALVSCPGGGWRLFVSCSTRGSKHWWIDAIEADDPREFDASTRRTVFPGDQLTAVKDPVISADENGWRAWVCCHPLDDPDATDRMYTRDATSDDGWSWTWGQIVLGGRPDAWDARGARVSEVLLDRDPPVAYYDGRANAAENWKERTGLAVADHDGTFASVSDEPAAASPHGHRGLRYVSVVQVANGYRLYYEACRADGAHELRTELVPGEASVHRATLSS
jgi:hypothetical protein